MATVAESTQTGYDGGMAFTVLKERDPATFFEHYPYMPRDFEKFETPEDLIVFLHAIGFDMRLYRKRPSKRLQIFEKLRGYSEEVGVEAAVRNVLREFKGDTDYFVALGSQLTTPGGLYFQGTKLGYLYRRDVDPTYAAAMLNAGISDLEATAQSWADGVPVEYATLALAG